MVGRGGGGAEVAESSASSVCTVLYVPTCLYIHSGRAGVCYVEGTDRSVVYLRLAIIVARH